MSGEDKMDEISKVENCQSCAIIERLNETIKSQQKEIEELKTGPLVEVSLWDFGQDGRDAATKYLVTVKEEDVSAFCEWYQLYHNIKVDNNFTKFQFHRMRNSTWDREEGKKLLQDKLSENKYNDMIEWINKKINC